MLPPAKGDAVAEGTRRRGSWAKENGARSSRSGKPATPFFFAVSLSRFRAAASGLPGCLFFQRASCPSSTSERRRGQQVVECTSSELGAPNERGETGMAAPDCSSQRLGGELFSLISSSERKAIPPRCSAPRLHSHCRLSKGCERAPSARTRGKGYAKAALLATTR